MIIKWHLYRFLLVSLSIGYSSMHGVEVISGNVDSETSSFNFTIGPHAFYQIQGRFFAGATKAIPGNTFALSAAFRSENKFRPLAPEKVVLNNAADQENPLFGAGIYKLASYGAQLLALKKGDPASLYLIDDLTNHPKVTMLSAHDIADANGSTASNIVTLVAQTNPLPDNHLLGAEQGIGAFLAVTNAAGGFDGNGSGIAYARTVRMILEENPETKEQKTEVKLSVYDAQTGTQDGNRAVSINLDLTSLGINGPLASIANSVGLHWDPFLERLYVALSVQSTSMPTSGARAILVGSVSNGKIVFQPIAANGAFNAGDSIVGTLSSDASVSIHKVRTLQTTTHLRYLVVLGGNGDPIATQSEVFAMPLVDLPGSIAHGTLANVTSIPVDDFVDREPFRIKTFRFIDAALQPNDLFTSSSIAARVGGNGLLPGAIQDMVVGKDCIFVSVLLNGNNQQAGIFYSQALFDTHGRIKAWTDWQRAGIVGSLLGFAFDYTTGNFWTLPTQDGLTTNTVARTQWGSKDALTALTSTTFKCKKGGVQGLFDFPYTTTGFSTSIGSRISLIVMTGFNKVLIVQSGTDTNGLFGPVNSFAGQIFSNNGGSLTGFAPGANALRLSGGALSDIGPIIAAEIVTDGNQAWLVVGGSGGLAVLAEPDGSGWNAQLGLGKGFSGLTPTMQFKRIGNFCNVRKLISSGSQLFILTPFKLARMTLTNAAIEQGAFGSITLARSSDLVGAQGSFADAIISGPLGLIATSRGLCMSGTNVDIRIAQTTQEANWQLLTLPEVAGSLCNVGPISKLYAISPTGIEKEVFQESNAQSIAGNLLVLNSYIGYHQAQVYRLNLDLGSDVITTETITLFRDLFVKNRRTFFTSFGSYRSSIATDGAIFLAANSRYGKGQPLVFILASSLKSGQIESGRTGHELSLEIKDFTSVGQLVRRSASGNWLIHGDFGIRVNA